MLSRQKSREGHCHLRILEGKGKKTVRSDSFAIIWQMRTTLDKYIDLGTKEGQELWPKD
jgi:hypothetical protein